MDSDENVIVDRKGVGWWYQDSNFRIEFICRCSSKLRELLCLNDQQADELAEDIYSEWDGIDTPEECAEEEASRWGD